MQKLNSKELVEALFEENEATRWIAIHSEYTNLLTMNDAIIKGQCMTTEYAENGRGIDANGLDTNLVLKQLDEAPSGMAILRETNTMDEHYVNVVAIKFNKEWHLLEDDTIVLVDKYK